MSLKFLTAFLCSIAIAKASVVTVYEDEKMPVSIASRPALPTDSTTIEYTYSAPNANHSYAMYYDQINVGNGSLKIKEVSNFIDPDRNSTRIDSFKPQVPPPSLIVPMDTNFIPLNPVPMLYYPPFSGPPSSNPSYSFVNSLKGVPQLFTPNRGLITLPNNTSYVFEHASIQDAYLEIINPCVGRIIKYMKFELEDRAKSGYLNGKIVTNSIGLFNVIGNDEIQHRIFTDGFLVQNLKVTFGFDKNSLLPM